MHTTLGRVTGTERPPAVAGRFYDRDERRLRRQVSGCLTAAAPATVTGLRGLVVPHAGHVYSGPIAAIGYQLVDPERWRRVLMLGPAHFEFVPGIAASSARRWTTPMGPVPLAADAIAELVAAGHAAYDDRAHAPEHCLEVQLPFLQAVQTGPWTLIPLLVGHADPAAVAALIDAALDETTLLVVSTDLSHYLPYDEAARVDAVTAQRVIGRAGELIGDRDACGAYALRGALAWCRSADVSVQLLDLRNSGDTAGDRSRVVGYGAFALRTG